MAKSVRAGKATKMKGANGTPNTASPVRGARSLRHKQIPGPDSGPNRG